MAFPKGAKHPSNVKRALETVAQDLGYTVGEFSLRQMNEAKNLLEKWKEYLDTDCVPPELGSMSLREARQLFDREARSLASEERKWANYFHAKKKSTEVSGPEGEPVKQTIEVVFR